MTGGVRVAYIPAATAPACAVTAVIAPFARVWVYWLAKPAVKREAEEDWGR
jgi:hypothetical protein